MDRYALEFNIDGKWIRLVHYTGLTKQRAEFLMYLCQRMSTYPSYSNKQLRCVSL